MTYNVDHSNTHDGTRQRSFGGQDVIHTLPGMPKSPEDDLESSYPDFVPDWIAHRSISVFSLPIGAERWNAACPLLKTLFGWFCKILISYSRSGKLTLKYMGSALLKPGNSRSLRSNSFVLLLWLSTWQYYLFCPTFNYKMLISQKPINRSRCYLHPCWTRSEGPTSFHTECLESPRSPLISMGSTFHRDPNSK